MGFASLGKPLRNGSVTLQPGTLSAALIVPLADEWTDLYSIVITTNDTASQTVTISDGTTSVGYLVGGSAGGNNPPVLDQGATPVRFRKGATITATAGNVTAGKTIFVNARGLSSKT